MTSLWEAELVGIVHIINLLISGIMKTINVQSTVMVVWKFKRIFKKLCILWLTCESLSSEAIKGKLAE